MARKRPTIADIRANKGKVQYTMMRTLNWEELAAAELKSFQSLIKKARKPS